MTAKIVQQVGSSRIPVRDVEAGDYYRIVFRKVRNTSIKAHPHDVTIREELNERVLQNKVVDVQPSLWYEATQQTDVLIIFTPLRPFTTHLVDRLKGV